MLCPSHINIWNVANHMKKTKTKNIKMLDLLMKKWKLWVWCFLFIFFMWFARFQILICEPQSIWRKLLVVSWLYQPRSFLKFIHLFHSASVLYRTILRVKLAGLLTASKKLVQMKTKVTWTGKNWPVSSLLMRSSTLGMLVIWSLEGGPRRLVFNIMVLTS